MLSVMGVRHSLIWLVPKRRLRDVRRCRVSLSRCVPGYWDFGRCYCTMLRVVIDGVGMMDIVMCMGNVVPRVGMPRGVNRCSVRFKVTGWTRQCSEVYSAESEAPYRALPLPLCTLTYPIRYTLPSAPGRPPALPAPWTLPLPPVLTVFAPPPSGGGG